MPKKKRKIRPNPPPWSFLSSGGRGEDCHRCKNTNNCGNCKRSKEQVAEQKTHLNYNSFSE